MYVRCGKCKTVVIFGNSVQKILQFCHILKKYNSAKIVKSFEPYFQNLRAVFECPFNCLQVGHSEQLCQ